MSFSGRFPEGKPFLTGVYVANLKDNKWFKRAKKKQRELELEAGRQNDGQLLDQSVHGNIIWHSCSLEPQRRTTMFPWEIILRSQRMYVPFLSIEQFHRVLIQPGFFNLGVKCRASPGCRATAVLRGEKKKKGSRFHICNKLFSLRIHFAAHYSLWICHLFYSHELSATRKGNRDQLA